MAKTPIKPPRKKVNERPQFRPGPVLSLALHLYNEETVHTPSQTMRMALNRFIPRKYFDQAAKRMNGKKALA